MKKIFILLLLFACVKSGFAQEKMIDILDSLTARDHNTKTKIETEHSDYFEMMRNKQNFHIPQYNQSTIYLSSYKNYSVYMMVWDGIFSDEERKNRLLVSNSMFDKQAILFDNNRSHCYLLKYGDERHRTCFSFVPIDGDEFVYIFSRFVSMLSAIISLDNNLRPMFGTKIDIAKGYGYNELDALYEYTQYQDSDMILEDEFALFKIGDD